MATTPSLYPLSTRNGEAIPLEVIEPVALLYKNFTTAAGAITIPAGYEIAVLYASQDCVLELGATIPSPLIEGTSYAKTLFIPAGVSITAQLVPGAARLMGLSLGGVLMVQAIRKWASLALQQQASRT